MIPLRRGRYLTPVAALGGLLTPAWLPSGALLFADFSTEGATNHYWANAQEYGSAAAWYAALSGTFARTASSAHRTNASGVLELMSPDVLRFNYNPVTLLPKGILYEAARTNSCLQSQTLNHASWTASEVAVNANAAVAPDGSTTAELLVPSGVSGLHRLNIARTFTAAAWTASYFVKASGYSKCGIREVLVTGAYATFDLSGSGSVVSTNLATGAIEKLADDWYRVSMTYTASAEPHAPNLYVLDNAYVSGNPNSHSYSGDGSSGVIAWGAQFELGASPSSYIPTTTGSVTRAADDLSIVIPSGIDEITYTFDDETTEADAVAPGAYSVPTTLSRPNIKQMVALPA